MRLREILDQKGRTVVSVDPDQAVSDAIRILVDRGIGSVVVIRDGDMVGILTERDVLRLVGRSPESIHTLKIAEVMTSDVIIGAPDDDVAYVMTIMTRNRVRHLPVLSGGRLEGIISIGDVVNAVRRDVEAENRHLRDYVQGKIR